MESLKSLDQYPNFTDKKSVYVSPEFYKLKVNNSFFNSVDLYNRVVQDGGVNWLRMREDFGASLSEDLVGTGSYSLKVSENQVGELVLSSPGYKDSDIVDISLLGSKVRVEQGHSYVREWAEAVGVEKLREMVLNAEVGQKMMWTSPPGDKDQGYPWQVSITYFGQVNQTTDGRQLDVSLYVNPLSLEGHGWMYRLATGKEVTELSDIFFVASPEVLPNQVSLQSSEALFSLVNQVVKAGFVNPEANVQNFMNQEVFHKCRAQIDHASDFLSWVVSDLYIYQKMNLRQADVEAIELAYSFAYRVVKQYSQTGLLVSTDDLLEDYLDQLKFKDQLGQEVVTIDQWRDLRVRQTRLNNRYGDLSEESVGGRGCPSGGLVGMGLDWGSLASESVSLQADVLWQTGDNPLYIWECGVCGFRNKIDVPKKILKEKCDKCHNPGKC